MKPLADNLYLQDILSQPEALLQALAAFDPNPLQPIAQALQQGAFERILLTGMGASLYAAYPTWLTLTQAGLPAIWIDTAELIHHARGLVTSRTLLWVFSQSGRSAEIVSALDFDRLAQPTALLATVNDLESPLAEKSARFSRLSACLPVNAGKEQTVSTRTYINSLALSQLAAVVLTGQELTSAQVALQQTATAMQAYLANWQGRLQEIGELIGYPKRLFLLGRGDSLATTYVGALVLGEAAKYCAVPFQAGEFRHGPLELATPELCALIFAGAPETRQLNARLLKELRSYQTAAFWVGADTQKWQIEIPEVPVLGMPLVEILPIQLLSIHLARQAGIEPGQFTRISKVTLFE